MTIAGKRAVVVGRSNIVGLPAALLLQNRDATVTMVHSRTPNAQAIAAGAASAVHELHAYKHAAKQSACVDTSTPRTHD